MKKATLIKKYMTSIMAEIEKSKKYLALSEDEKLSLFKAEEKDAEEKCPSIIDFFVGWISKEEFDRVKSAPAMWSGKDIKQELARRMSGH